MNKSKDTWTLFALNLLMHEMKRQFPEANEATILRALGRACEETAKNLEDEDE